MNQTKQSREVAEKMRATRKRTALACALALLAGAFVSPPAGADPTTTDPNILAHYTFETAGAVTDVSGHGNNGTLLGTGATVSNGVLTLPGGSATSGAGYVRFPNNMFDNRDTLTISTWLKNTTGAGNYSAMFFGSATGTYPAQYWLLNPRNGSNQFKSVITNGSAPSSPWSTEYGISPTNASQGIAGPVTDDQWAMYTTVITPTSITGYYNGSLIGTVATTRTVSQFGTGLAGFIGRSTYSDIYYKGNVDDVLVSTGAYSGAQVADLYHSNGRVTDDQTRTVLAADADKVTLPAEAIADLSLPAGGASGSIVTWESDLPGVISAAGAVTRPGAGSADATVTLTATFTLGGVSYARDYAVTVPAVDDQRDLARIADAFTLGIEVVSDDINLADATGDFDISWASSAPAIIASDGAVTRQEAETEVTLTATFARGDLNVTRDYRVTVLAAATGDVVSYVATGGTARTEALHLAIATDGDPLVALNNNKPVLFPRYGTGSSRFANPTLFRKPDGSFGLIATDNAANGHVFVYDSSDLVTFSNQRYVSTNSQGIVVSRADVAYDNALAAYRVVLLATNGQAWEVTTSDFTKFSAPVQVTAPAVVPVPGLPGNAIEASALRLTAEELSNLDKRLGRITNTGISVGEDVTIQAGESLDLPGKATLDYSDGSTKQLGVTWDTSTVDATRPGTYTVTGTVNQPTYGDADGILVPERADPWVFRDDTRTGSTEYYFTGSYPTTQQVPGVGYDRVVLRRSDTINGLTTAKEEVLLWSRNAASPDTSNGSKVASGAYRYFWAPEFHKINGDWYILFTSSRSTNVWDIRPAIMRCDGDLDPMVASNWEELGYMKAAAGDTAAFANFSLDMTYFENGGKHYMIWAEKPGSSDLRMAEIDPSNPQQLISRSILLSTPNYAWERTSSQVINEGPAVIKSDNEVFVFFSASEVNETYAIGMLRAPTDGDLMDPATWRKTGFPLLTSDDFGGAQEGPGHNSFTLDADGNPVIVYHARPAKSEWAPGADGGLNDPSRHARVKTVHFAADGSAVLNQTREEELAPSNRTVTLTVTVEGAEPSLDVSAAVVMRCVVGRVTPTVRVTNGEGVAVAADIEAPFGSRSLSVAAERSGSAAFTVRNSTLAAGTVEVTARATVNGAPVTEELSVAYDAVSCS
ncbi:Beta-xylosidase, GH43 family [Tessaracoccus bendigoensis DSM 12906]|uniref:Beta-xylosidase, GH43 family n=2 Tax=Tessaracoccus TaxID=72763 RepID=A0A1M6G7L9_9ACTN|nr:Beta-xylosidase, GH43 family [Tessaracoccus bendigoensis DSM 12906]